MFLKHIFLFFFLLKWTTNKKPATTTTWYRTINLHIHSKYLFPQCSFRFRFNHRKPIFMAVPQQYMQEHNTVNQQHMQEHMIVPQRQRHSHQQCLAGLCCQRPAVPRQVHTAPQRYEVELNPPRRNSRRLNRRPRRGPRGDVAQRGRGGQRGRGDQRGGGEGPSAPVDPQSAAENREPPAANETSRRWYYICTWSKNYHIHTPKKNRNLNFYLIMYILWIYEIYV